MTAFSTNPMILSGPPATIDDLYNVEGKAELIGGSIVRFMPTGDLPSEVELEIIVRLREYAKHPGSEGDYTAAAELELAAKRADYFEAGTQVVWDVDPLARTITSYRADSTAQPTTFRGRPNCRRRACGSWLPACCG